MCSAIPVSIANTRDGILCTNVFHRSKRLDGIQEVLSVLYAQGSHTLRLIKQVKYSAVDGVCLASILQSAARCRKLPCVVYA